VIKKYITVLACLTVLIVIFLTTAAPLRAEEKQSGKESLLATIKDSSGEINTEKAFDKVDSLILKIKKAVSEIYLKAQAYTWPFSIGALPVGIFAVIAGIVLGWEILKRLGSILLVLAALKWIVFDLLPLLAPGIFIVPK
jgi:hypothetical protein